MADRIGVVRERRERSRVLPDGRYRLVVYSWHYLDNGERYHYIHVSHGCDRLPFRRWVWVTDADGSNPRSIH